MTHSRGDPAFPDGGRHREADVFCEIAHEQKDLSERDICTKFITPALQQAGWDVLTQVREEVGFTRGRIACPAEDHEKDHDDPKCGLSTKLNTFHCLKCGAKGGPVPLVKLACDCTTREAEDWLREHGFWPGERPGIAPARHLKVQPPASSFLPHPPQSSAPVTRTPHPVEVQAVEIERGDLVPESEDACAPLQPPSPEEMHRLVEKFGPRMKKSLEACPPDAVEQLALVRGLTPEAIRQLGAEAWGNEVFFPMYDAAGQVVGRRRRKADGGTYGGGQKALTEKGSRNGIMRPDPFPDGSMVQTEGEMDAAAKASILPLPFISGSLPPAMSCPKKDPAAAKAQYIRENPRMPVKK